MDRRLGVTLEKASAVPSGYRELPAAGQQASTGTGRHRKILFQHGTNNLFGFLPSMS
jgi:hypothetical protein